MIQFSNLLLTGTDNTTTGSSNSSHSSSTTPPSLDSFETALSDALAATLEQFGINPSDVKISIGPATDSSTSPAAPPSPAAPGNTTSPTAPTTPPGMPTYDPFLQAAWENNPAPPTAGTTPPVSTTAPPAAGTTPPSSQTTPGGPAADPMQVFDDAYWAKQPAAVQQLRHIQDSNERTLLATQLANAGYQVDVPIMVWQWDPYLTTNLRQSLGYTWVPSALQNPIEMAPNIGSLPGLPAYDPKNAPAGSIAV